MGLKVLCIFAFLGVFLVQGSYAANEDVKIDWQGIIEQAKEWCQKQIDKMKQFFVDAVDTIKAKWNEVTDEINEIYNKVKNKLTGIFEDAKKKIDDWVEAAKQQGVNVDECLKDEKVEFEKLGEDILNREEQCLLNEYESVKKIVDSVVNDVTTVWDTVENLPNDLMHCLSNPSWDCVMDVKDKVVSAVQDLPQHLQKDIIEATKIIAAIKPRLEMCAAKELAAALLNSGHIVDDIATCIKSKMTGYKVNMYKYNTIH